MPIMNNLTLYSKINSMPDIIRTEILDYMEYLIKKHKTKKIKKHPKAGCMKGIFTMKDDFDEPLDDFKEYME